MSKTTSSDDFIIVDPVLDEQSEKDTISNSSQQENAGEKATEIDSTQEKTLDLVFVMDCTGSMSSYIASAKDKASSLK